MLEAVRDDVCSNGAGTAGPDQVPSLSGLCRVQRRPRASLCARRPIPDCFDSKRSFERG
jgi:hypothetical protein